MFTRRSFLQKSALTAGAIGLSARVRAASEGANGDIRVAVVGFDVVFAAFAFFPAVALALSLTVPRTAGPISSS